MNFKKATIGIFLFFLLIASTLTVQAAIADVTVPTEAFLGSSTSQSRSTSITSTFVLTTTANTSVDITNSGVPTKYSLEFSEDGTTFTSSLTSIAIVTGTPKTITIRGNISEDTNSGLQTLGSISIDDTVGTPKTFPLKINPETKLKIKEVTAEYRSEKVTGLDDGDSFDEVKPGDTLTLTVEVENKYTDNEDIAFDNVEIEVIIEELDDGDDESDISSDFRLKEGNEDSRTFIFDIPSNSDEETFDIVIIVTGEADLDIGSADHKEEIRIEMTVEREENDVQITSFTPDNSILSCSRITDVFIKLENLGSRDQDEVRLTVKNDLLNINYEKKDIELSNDIEDDDSKFSVTIPIEIADDIPAEKYKLRAQVYFEETIIDDLKDLELEIKDCGSEELEEETTEETTESKETGTPITEFTRPSTKQSNYTSLLGLVSAALFGGLVIMSILLYRARK